MKRPPRFWWPHEQTLTDPTGRWQTLRVWGWSDESEAAASGLPLA